LLISFKYSINNYIVKKLEQKSQSADNIISGITETLREGIVNIPRSPAADGAEGPPTNFVDGEDIKLISKHVPKHIKPLNDEQLGYYLAGLIDGDGHFSKIPQLVLVFSSPDAFLAYYIKSQLGYGTVKKVRSKKILLLVITKSKGLEKVYNLINGKIRTQLKYDDINKYIFNDPCLNLRMDFKLNNSNCLDNHWLAGFSDALAIFQIIGLNSQRKLSFQLKNPNKNLLILIKSFLGGNTSYNDIEDSYKYDSDSFGSARKVIKYFDKYHLLSTKHIDYLK
jgi:hypothetical protein